MRNLMLGLVLGLALGLASTGALAQRAPSPTFPDAVTAAPKHYSVSFENELVRFLRVKVGPGERSPMHRHPPGCVVYLTDQTFKFSVPDGSAEEESVPAGALGCGDGSVHATENVGKQDAEFIMVEFKNRTTFRTR